MTAPTLTRVIVSVADLERALAFYDGVLGLHQKIAPPGFAMLTMGSGPGAVELMLHERTPRPSMAGVALTVRVPDVDRTTQAAQALGCTIIDRAADQPWGERQAVLTDPDGHVICLSSPLA
ncbi:MAG TPA: VOC family protein [Pseudonocardia sp.]|jgi:catechol 2,3-dioxygenase-like lactoylglutathione lyase family enzyme